MISMEEAGVTAASLPLALKNVAQGLYSRGFDVIGSRGKLPNLHKWKGVDREQLLEWCMLNLDNGKANSLTLRLDNTQLCAFDLDFPSSDFTDDFIRRINRADLVPQLFTTSGKKGCKIFFRAPFEVKQELPLHLGPSVLCDDGRKFDLEIKKDLSVVFGAYPEHEKLYSEYPQTTFIVQSLPSDLPELDADKITRIKVAYCNTIQEYALKGALVFNYGFNDAVQKVKAVIAYDVLHNHNRIYSFLIDVGDEIILRALCDFYDGQTIRRLPQTAQAQPLVQAVKEMQQVKDMAVMQLHALAFEQIYEPYKLHLMGVLASKGINTTMQSSVIELYERYFIERTCERYKEYLC